MNIFQAKTMQVLKATIFSCLFFSQIAHANLPHKESRKSLNEYVQECPWIGLVAQQITYGSITISDVNIHEGNKLAIVRPGETLKGSLKYKINSHDLRNLHLYHMVIGIKDEGAQDCVVHNLGLWDAKGIGKFTIKAPKTPGIYELRFLLSEGLTCSAARNMWDSRDENPPAATTIGILIVE